MPATHSSGHFEKEHADAEMAGNDITIVKLWKNARDRARFNVPPNIL